MITYLFLGFAGKTITKVSQKRIDKGLKDYLQTCLKSAQTMMKYSEEKIRFHQDSLNEYQNEFKLLREIEEDDYLKTRC
jgi:ABC-type transporter MlaC component